MSLSYYSSINDSDDTNFSDGSDNDIIDQIKLEAGDLKILLIGIYELSIPQPNFHIQVKPQSTAITSTLVRTNDTGEYKLAYHFQNFQDRPCTVTVWVCEES